MAFNKINNFMNPVSGLFKKVKWILLLTVIFWSSRTAAQGTTPTVVSDQNAISMEGAAGSASVYDGISSYSLPIYTIQCGSLRLPISLNYGYNGLKLDETIEWTGLGWSLQAGGAINRVVQGGVDNTKNTGRNYGEYSIKDSLSKPNNLNFLNNIYADAHDTSFDPAPDIYDCSFNGYSARFYWYNGKAFLLSYNKELSISWPTLSGNITITTGDGTKYVFGQTQAAFLYEFKFFEQINYTAAWYLTSVISSDKKDTISLSYATHTTQSYSSIYADSYPQGTYDFGLFTDSILPTNSYPYLQNIRCRNSRISFIPDPVLRTDEKTNGPKLREIDVIDSISGKIVKKNFLSFEYLNQTTSSPQYMERLKLKTFSFVNPQSAADSQTYRFSYIQEYSSYPPKFSNVIDDWGYYNGSSPYPLITKNLHNLRLPNFSYCSYGALDTVRFPTGGFDTYQYELNDYDSGATQHHAPGPGIRIKSVAGYLPGAAVPATSKNYSYLADNGTSSSGSLNHFNSTSGPIGIVDTFDFNNYVMTNNNPGSAIKDNIFFYGKVSESSSAGNEKHKSDYYFKSFSNAVDEVELTKSVNYRYDSTSATFYPLTATTNTYDSTTDSIFLSIRPYIDSSYVIPGIPNTLLFAYGYTYDYNPTYWLRLTDQRSVQYDNLNDSAVSTRHFNYNTVRNMDSVRETLADGNATIKKFKYADDYTTSITGGLITNHVIDPVIETQLWLQHAGSAPAMVSGSIISCDTVIFKPIATYSLEPVSPLASLNNETLTSGKYNTLLSDNVNYILKRQLYYDGNSNLDHSNRTSDITISYIYDYKHSLPVAEIANASGFYFAFTSFEGDNNGNWSVPDTLRNRTNSMTGKQCYNLVTGKTITTSFPSGVQYVLSYWSTSSAATVTASGLPVTASPPGLTKNGWTYHEHIIPTSASSVNVTATSTLIDELRLHPVTAQMTTYTYDPLVGKTSFCSPNNMISYYEYDGFNRLKDIKDMDRNIVKLYDYQFNQSYTYGNDLLTEGFVRNNCACNYMGSGIVTDTVQANTFTSHAGKWDANQLAQSYLNANGQNYANTHGSCVAISCSGVDKHIVFCTTCETGTKVYTSSVWSPSEHEYLCTYHYHWSDGVDSVDYQEYDKTSCPIN